MNDVARRIRQSPLPEPLARFLARACQLEREQGSADAENHLLAYYLEWLPNLRIRSLSADVEPAQTLFHTPVDLDAMPLLRSVVGRYEQLLRLTGSATRAPISPDWFNGAPTLAELFAHTFYGPAMPMLYCNPNDMAAYLRELEAGCSASEVIDRRLTGPLSHELMHFGKERHTLMPLLLDECIAGYLGVLLCPTLAFPQPGDDNAMLGAHWFSQVGQALVRCFGLNAVVNAQSGAVGWNDVLPLGLVDRLADLGWAQYVRTRDSSFLCENTRPTPWIKAFYLARNGRSVDDLSLADLDAVPWTDLRVGAPEPMDWDMLCDGLRAMCTHSRLVDGCYRVTAQPPDGPIQIDVSSCEIGRDGPVADEPAAPRHLFPPHLAADLATAGVTKITVLLNDLERLEDAAAAIWTGQGCEDPGLRVGLSFVP